MVNGCIWLCAQVPTEHKARFESKKVLKSMALLVPEMNSAQAWMTAHALSKLGVEQPSIYEVSSKRNKSAARILPFLLS